MVRVKTPALVIHIACWLLFLSLPLLFLSGREEGEPLIARMLSLHYFLFYSVYIFIFYFNTELLIPRLYLKRKYTFYFSIVLVLLIAISFLKPFDHLLAPSRRHWEMERRMTHISAEESLTTRTPDGEPGSNNFAPPRRRPQRIDITSIVLFVMIISLGMAFQIMGQWRISERRAVQAEADKANAELSFLKAQIHPHFLFNTLNNIYSLAVSGSENTAASILRLSNIMRYVTEDSTQNFVSLRQEVNCIKDYIELQRLRLNKKTRVDFSVTGYIEQKQIAPLVLITFIENAFKYGVSNHEASRIIIRLAIEENKIVFHCQNNLFITQKAPESTGIGIANTKERLEYLYPSKHTLTITNQDGLFIVDLTLMAPDLGTLQNEDL